MKSFRPISIVASVLVLAGCNILPSNEIEYKSAAKVNPLEVPPDLIAPSRDDRFALPASGSASRAEFERSRAEPRRENNTVLPTQAGMRIQRDADQRVLVVDQPAEKLWPIVRQFWLDNGFVLAAENPSSGFLETDWAENRAKIPEDIIRRTIGKVFDRIYDTGERDKFRTRIDRVSDQQTEIVISHRGLIEVATGGASERFTWTNRPSDRQLEAEFLRRLMVRLGADQSRADVLLAQAEPTAPGAQLFTAGNMSVIEIAESFDRAWRRVGVAIDRLGFTVEDRDRAQGAFFVRYRDPTADATKENPGFFSKMFSGSTSSDSAEQYQVKITAIDPNRSQVAVFDKQGRQITDRNSQRMLSVIYEQLK
jgi:outer membrane protein assembly factor BamC